MHPALRIIYYSNSGGSEALPTFTNWWQGVGDVVPLSTNYTVYDPVGAADLAASYVNLANPGTRNAVPGAAGPTHAQGMGWTFLGSSSQYLNSQYFPTATSTVIVMFEDAPNVSGYAFGLLHNSPTPVRWMSLVPDSSTTLGWAVGDLAGSTVQDMTSGIAALNQSKVYRNGYPDSGYTPTWTGGTVNKNLFIGALNNGASGATTFFTGRILKMAIYDFILSEAQVLAVAEAMMSEGESALHSYSNAVLSLNPYAYYPCNLKSGYTFMRDYSGNNRIAYAKQLGWSGGHAGKYGNALFCNKNVANSQIRGHVENENVAGNFHTLNADEFAFAAWINLSYTAPLNQKIVELWRDNNDYAAFEVRNTNVFTIHLRENGISQDIVETGVNGIEDTWHHLVCFNSKSQGKTGFYLDGVKTEFNRTLGGHVVFTNKFCEVGIIDGYIQHMVFLDYVPNQAQVNSLQ